LLTSGDLSGLRLELLHLDREISTRNQGPEPNGRVPFRASHLMKVAGIIVLRPRRSLDSADTSQSTRRWRDGLFWLANADFTAIRQAVRLCGDRWHPGPHSDRLGARRKFVVKRGKTPVHDRTKYGISLNVVESIKILKQCFKLWPLIRARSVACPFGYGVLRKRFLWASPSCREDGEDSYSTCAGRTPDSERPLAMGALGPVI
jgi:hypothetical protein